MDNINNTRKLDVKDLVNITVNGDNPEHVK